MMKKIFGILLMVCLLGGWTVRDAPYILCSSNLNNEDVIYFTVEDVSQLVVDENVIINTGNGQVIGYEGYSTEIFFDTYSMPYYQSGVDVDDSPIYSPYTITEILENHLNDYKYKNYQNIILAILSGIFFVSLVKEIKTKKGNLRW